LAGSYIRWNNGTECNLLRQVVEVIVFFLYFVYGTKGILWNKMMEHWTK
jgi:hypothetical protein